MKTGLLFGSLACAALIAGLGGFLVFQSSDLERIHAGIAANYEDVAHIPSEEFATLERSKVVLFDVRESDEFAVSHLPGAIQVAPDITMAEFELRFASELEDKRAVFYCSVGMRSTILADRVAALVERQTGKPPVNLIGGLFQWHNEGRLAVSTSGDATSAIHPFDDYWGRLIEDQAAVSYTPRD